MTIPLFDTSGLDPTPEDAEWREKCQAEFGLVPVPHEVGRYYPGYWQECYEYHREKGEK